MASPRLSDTHHSEEELRGYWSTVFI